MLSKVGEISKLCSLIGSDKSEECVICMLPIVSDEKLRLKCGHDCMHKKCIVDWITIKP